MKVTIYLREDYINKDSQASLNMRVFLNGKYFFIPLLNCIPENFNQKSGKIIAGVDKNIQNHIIKDAIGKASGIILKYKVNKKALTRELFEKEFKNPAVLSNFYSFMEDQIKMRIGEITASSAKQHTACLNKMKGFKKTCMLVELDETFIRDFEKYLKNTLKNNANTIFNTLKTLKTYINRALKQELLTVSPFRYYKMKRVKTYPEFLSEDELTSLFDLYRSNALRPTHQNILRWFLFSSQTGLRIGDLRAIEHENIKNGLMTFRPKKTANVNNKRVEMPLTKKALNLIKDENPLRIKGLIFDCISEQKMNKNIKVIAESINIDKDISFHTARHTFASLFLKRSKRANGILILKELLGHSHIETTMVYSHVLDEDIKSAMDDFQH